MEAALRDSQLPGGDLVSAAQRGTVHDCIAPVLRAPAAQLARARLPLLGGTCARDCCPNARCLTLIAALAQDLSCSRRCSPVPAVLLPLSFRLMCSSHVAGSCNEAWALTPDEHLPLHQVNKSKPGPGQLRSTQRAWIHYVHVLHTVPHYRITTLLHTASQIE